ncbi:MAG: hypothetical protein NHB14_27020 [Desulfosporosinus sp.]|nr:hypothetical protein [Desulfosporosinus sp.]
MKLSKIARVLLVSVALLTVGAPIASAAPQAYWTAQPTDPSQPGQQAPGYGYGYGYGCGCGYYGGYNGNWGW